jgi:hypothetical protein
MLCVVIKLEIESDCVLDYGVLKRRWQDTPGAQVVSRSPGLTA